MPVLIGEAVLKRLSFTCLILASLLLSADSRADVPASSAALPDAVEIRLITYNVQNLPGSDFDSRAPALIALLDNYDLAVLQEDFTPGGLYSRWGSTVHRGPMPRWRWHNMLAPLFRPLGYAAPYDSGLTVLAGEAGQGRVTLIEPLVLLPFEVCHGIVTYSHDCWANKGLLGVRVTLTNGAGFDLYTTHMDAGSHEGDHQARVAQLALAEEAIATFSADRAVVFAGDFNTPRKRPRQHAAFAASMAAIGLEDSMARPTHADWHACQRDFIFLRSGGGVRLEVREAGEPSASTPGAGPEGVDFCAGDSWRGRALSDHPALAVTLAISAAE